jgi:single-strand selective monofunctional uracil DNA glycosylase
MSELQSGTARELKAITGNLDADLRRLTFALPTAFVYNPLDYARGAWDEYCARYARSGIDALFVGMNPGPFGMAQTGIPFGAIPFVRDWLQIRTPSGLPAVFHPKRPVLGFDCPRIEVSGQRLWGFAKDVFVTPDAFFDHFFVTNYCPLMFLEESGRNRTPDALPLAERGPLLVACNRALRSFVGVLKPRVVVGVGAFAEARVREALDGVPVLIGRVTHPSPANPSANRGWSALASKELAGLGLL